MMTTMLIFPQGLVVTTRTVASGTKNQHGTSATWLDENSEATLTECFK